MKRDMELIRERLLEIETNGASPIGWVEGIEIPGYSTEQINHHVWLLWEAGFIDALDNSSQGNPCYYPRCLTWQGHEFLDAIRNRDIWQKTKDIVGKAGTATVSAIFEVAIGIGRERIQQALGLAS